MTATTAAKRLTLASRLLVLGLAVSAATLLWDHPLGFVVFVVIGGVLSLASGVLFLWALIAYR